MIRSIAFASVGVLAALTAAPPMARAQAPSDTKSYQQPQAGNVIGGGGASLSGGGDDRIIVYSSGGGGAGGGRFEQLGRIGIFAGSNGGGNAGGGGPSFTYSAPPASAAGREAWLVGGADDAQVVYSNPATSRPR
jgi:hypothetical protein